MMPLIKLNVACMAGVKGEGTGKKRAREPRDTFPPLLRPAMQAKPNGKVHAHACYGVDALDNYCARTLSYFKVALNLVPSSLVEEAEGEIWPNAFAPRDHLSGM